MVLPKLEVSHVTCLLLQVKGNVCTEEEVIVLVTGLNGCLV